jgi:fructose-bisphosphate aldolase class II
MQGEPRLDVERLARINAALQIPLVIHGGTGLSDDQFRRLIDHGVTKINYYTALADAAGGQVLANAAAEARGYTSLVDGVADAVRESVARCIEVWGSADRAETLLARCRPWRPVEHVILFNTEGLDAAGVDAMMAEGRRVLTDIPGVRRVRTGHAVQQGAEYRHCWLVRFAARPVIDSYREHPEHRRFADQRFRPFAGGRLSIDFEDADGDP